ncbi:MAG: sigma-70 family RNA polymerase sigma factor [Thermobifida fusca]
MTAPQRPERQQISEDHAFALLLRQGEGYERCYDAFAPALYRYCWTLLGAEQEDAAAEAVYETFLAAVELLPRLSDPDLFRAWLFALARAACERHGFAAQPAYAHLTVHSEQQPFVAALSALLPSQRELLELSLRHGLTHTQIAAVLGLDPETVSDLCRSAAQQAADLLTEQQPGGSPGSRWFIADIPLVVSSIALPGPPRSLRARVIADCSDATAITRREQAAALLCPLGANGFPLPGARGAEAEAAEPVQADAAVPAASASEADASPAAAEPETTDSAIAGEPHRLSGWLVPATAGLVTALVAFSLWGLGAFTNRPGNGTAAGTPPPVDGVSVAPMSDHVPASAAPDTGKVPSIELTEPTLEPTPEEPVEPVAPDSVEDDTAEPAAPPAEPDPAPPASEDAATVDPPAPAPQQPAPAPREEPASQPQPAPTAPAAPAPAPAPAQPAQEDPPPRHPGSGVISLLEGVLGLLGLHGNR